MAEKVKVLVPEEDVAKRIKELGEQISKDYAGKQVHLICVLKGGEENHRSGINGLYECQQLR